MGDWVEEAGRTRRVKAHRRNRGEIGQVQNTHRGEPSEVFGQR